MCVAAGEDHDDMLVTERRGGVWTSCYTALITAKRKSAVELLQESKAFYVKSETVLDRKQELKNSGHLQVTSEPGVLYLRAPLNKSSTPWNYNSSNQDVKYLQQHVLLLSPPPRPTTWSLPPTPQSAPPLPPKSPRLVSAAQRRSGSHHSAGSDQLQTKLRRLLSADSKENIFFADTEQRYLRLWDNEDDNVKTPGSKSWSGCSVHKSLPDLHTSPTTSLSSSANSSEAPYEARSVSSGRCWGQSPGYIPRDTMSTASAHTHKNQSECTALHAQHTQPVVPQLCTAQDCIRRKDSGTTSRSHDSNSSGRCKDTTTSHDSNSSCLYKDSGVTTRSHDSNSSGRQSQTVSRRPSSGSGGSRHQPTAVERLRRANLKDIESASSYSDSGAEDVSSPPLTRAGEGRRPILRSKSDISHRYSRGAPPVPVRPQPPRSTAQLELFFEQMGLDAHDYRCLSTPVSGTSSPVYFSSVSSVDSAVVWAPWGPESGGSLGGVATTNTHRTVEQLSIVERNARIIKWLCNCRKAQLVARQPS
uniref:Centrosome-associated FAM110 C-terminal domain-containing protein n=1 Tax=Timema bartmani TaxID=61472 RepID=A0A7R9EWV1_9NEOP|nr:unnamed protein product [Timema bartmani]